MMNREEQELELYVHIPFCVRKCAYCDFLSAPATDAAQEAYVQALQAEIRAGGRTEGGNLPVKTVFFGGGTPSVLRARLLAQLMETLRESFWIDPQAEITMEANPGTLTAEKLAIYRQAGINRLSLGLQSAQNAELRLLGRIHTWESFLESFHLARAAGFRNLNIDLMSALPGQTEATWEDTLQQVLALQPEHISAYSLIIEADTAFYQLYGPQGTRRQELPDEDAERLMYERTDTLLRAHGYQRYEISNYARTGYACRHNSGYWKGIPYLGFGLGASSCFGGKRFHNVSEMDAYQRAAGSQAQPAQLLDALRTEVEEQTVHSRMEEFCFLGLRMMEGIRRSRFLTRFGESFDSVYGAVVEKFVRLGLLASEGDVVRLTPAGIDVSNVIFEEFLFD